MEAQVWKIGRQASRGQVGLGQCAGDLAGIVPQPRDIGFAAYAGRGRLEAAGRAYGVQCAQHLRRVATGKAVHDDAAVTLAGAISEFG
ncbi:hypothetical protein [Hoeflea sp.]|uniref:hypothetical protein n=1 Tax=Hoeflea sp. TaxID=1940281 RepID=UPI0019A95DA3|nr:hypothetical protein [Hoeflea sp.]MBC7285582.1 hypothetical protein [Hoeflea sp.]